MLHINERGVRRFLKCVFFFTIILCLAAGKCFGFFRLAPQRAAAPRLKYSTDRARLTRQPQTFSNFYKVL